MSLATSCPSCGTVFRVQQDQLKTSEGWVRCGQCQEVFNALEGLFDLDRRETSGSSSRQAPPDLARPTAMPDPNDPAWAETRPAMFSGRDRTPPSAPPPPVPPRPAPAPPQVRISTRQMGTWDPTAQDSGLSMDISKASNFERFVFDLLGRDAAATRALFGDALARDGRFDLGANPLFAQAAARYGFESGKSTHADRLATIRDTWQRFGQMIDTHTADGVKVAREHRGAEPMVVLETALPIKFAATIEEALGRAPERPARFEGIEALPKRVQVMPADAQQVKAYIAAHCGE